jgi:transcriptional regulator with XRE-family HTH domain
MVYFLSRGSKVRVYTFLAMGYREFFAKRLKEARVARGYTQGRLAELSGVALNAIAKYETCVIIPTVETLQKLADALEVSGDYFLFAHSKMEGVPRVHDPALYERYIILETLSESDKAAAFNLMDALIERHRVRAITSKPVPPSPQPSKKANHKEAHT